MDLILLSAWCGLAAGLLEVGMRVGCRLIDPTDRLYLVSRHFLWLGPLSNLVCFAAIGLLSAPAVERSPRIAGWLASRLLGALTIWPMLMAAGPRIYPEAWFLVAFGVSVQVVPILRRDNPGLSRRLAGSFLAMAAVVVILVCYVFGAEQLQRAREAGRPLPGAETPNILLIVLDTVRADHLSLYGYNRPTTPNLERLAKRGIRFDQARATAPWTLPSHASMFTGRWPHELVRQWMTPITADFPMLAEYLGQHGYATAGFVANVGYCSEETGLARGFSHYEDYVLEKLAPLRTAALVEYLVTTIPELIRSLNIVALRPLEKSLDRWFLVGKRKDAESINHAFLAWLSGREDSRRPFFGFLNFLDAHALYILPPGARHRFTHRPVTTDEHRVVYESWARIDKLRLPRSYVNLARDSYDDCLGYLDEQLGLLFDELQRRGVLDRTLVIVTADHGEGLGEHNLFDHGESLYRTETRVPLVIVPPPGLDSPSVVSKAVSLRDLAATIADLSGLNPGSPFPGRSLARFWRPSRSANVDPARDTDPVVSELAAPNPTRPNQGRSPASDGPLISLTDDQYVYIRNEATGGEQLFDERGDPSQFSDRSGVPAMRTVVDDFRRRLDRFKGQSPRAAR